MAGNEEVEVKVSVNPFQEIDDKKLALMTVKEVGLKEIKKSNYFEYKDKFTVTSKKWNKRRLETQAEAIFRYDLALLAAQIWQAFNKVQKAKDGKPKQDAVKVFLAKVPKLVKKTDKKLEEKFEEFQEEISSGATDDLGELKSTRKSLTAGHPDAMMTAVNKYFDEFEKAFRRFEKAKKAEMRASGDAKEDAAQELEYLLKDEIAELLKKLNALVMVLKKRIGVLSGIPAAMKKSMAKDMSDAAIAQFKPSMDLLAKSISPVEAQISKYNNTVIAALQKMQKKDIGSSSYNKIVDADGKLNDATSKLEETMQKIDAKLKKLEQTAKKR